MSFKGWNPFHYADDPLRSLESIRIAKYAVQMLDRMTKFLRQSLVNDLLISIALTSMPHFFEILVIHSKGIVNVLSIMKYQTIAFENRQIWTTVYTATEMMK
jgi:hypothetical protein